MCQLLGMNCNVPTDVTFSFSGFSQRGGRTDHHSDGWGIAFFEGRGLRHFVDHEPAAESAIAQLIRRYPIKSRNVIAHIRKATQGAVNLQNCHPFVRELWGRYWVFAHNGDLKEFSPRLHGHFRPVGSTVSWPSAGSCRSWRNHTRTYPRSKSSRSPCANWRPALPNMAPSISCYPTVKHFGLTPRPACIIWSVPHRSGNRRWLTMT